MNIRYRNAQYAANFFTNNAPHCAPLMFLHHANHPPNMCCDEDRPNWGKTHARSRTRQGQWSAWPPEQGQRQRQSRGWQRGRRQSSSWQELFDTTELGRKEAASNARLRQEKPRAVARIRHRDLCFNLGNCLRTSVKSIRLTS